MKNLHTFKYPQVAQALCGYHGALPVGLRLLPVGLRPQGGLQGAALFFDPTLLLKNQATLLLPVGLRPRHVDKKFGKPIFFVSKPLKKPVLNGTVFILLG